MLYNNAHDRFASQYNSDSSNYHSVGKYNYLLPNIFPCNVVIMAVSNTDKLHSWKTVCSGTVVSPTDPISDEKHKCIHEC